MQVDVKFLFFKDEDGQRIKRFQYTAIDDCTRIRALKIYEHHNQASAVDFINYVVDKFPFRIKTIRTDNGHEFQTKFHWHVSDLGMLHVYIKPAPQDSMARWSDRISQISASFTKCWITMATSIYEIS